MIDPNDPNIPSVGQPFQVLTWYPTTVIACHCQGKGLMTLLITTGIQNPVKCQKCNKLYMATGLTPEGHIIVEVILVPSETRIM